jgi:DNA invertase Pin-like site-specific DNA recombinase
MNGTSATPGGGIPAVAYYRMSTDDQEDSIPQQREAVRKYAAEKGYRLVREYQDEGISGDSTEDREQFLQMIADARDLGDFRAIMCWDQKRFGRFDSIEAGYYCFPLKRAGVILALVNGGVIDFNDHTSRIVANVTQEGAHKDLRDHAANVTRGMQRSLENAGWVGKAPYAYRLEGPKYHKRLVLDDAHKAAVVRRIFREYAAGRSMNAIAAGLDADHIANPHGQVHALGGPPAWRADTIKVILENPAYVGDYRGRQYVHAKYETRGPGGRSEKTGGKRRRRPPSEWEIKPDTHEAVVDRETFAAAQARIARGRTGRSNHYADDEHPYLLHGLLRCGRCGCDLWGMRDGNGPAAGRTRYYECSNRKHNGKNACPGTTVREHEVLYDIADHLRREFFGTLGGEALSWKAARGELQPGDLPEAFAKVKARVAPPAGRGPQEAGEASQGAGRAGGAGPPQPGPREGPGEHRRHGGRDPQDEGDAGGVGGRAAQAAADGAGRERGDDGGLESALLAWFILQGGRRADRADRGEASGVARGAMDA